MGEWVSGRVARWEVSGRVGEKATSAHLAIREHNGVAAGVESGIEGNGGERAAGVVEGDCLQRGRNQRQRLFTPGTRALGLGLGLGGRVRVKGSGSGLKAWVV